MQLNVTVFIKIIIKGDEIGDFFDELAIAGGEIRFVGDFNCRSNSGKGEIAAFVGFFNFLEGFGNTGEIGGFGGDELFGESFDFFFGLRWSSEGVAGGPEVINLGAGENSV